MQFKIPQNVQREDTIIGPITMRQLIILAVGGGISYGMYALLTQARYKMIVWIPPVSFVAIFTIAFAFIKIKSVTFARFMVLMTEFLFLVSRKRVWKQGEGDVYPSVTTPMKKTKDKKAAQQEEIQEREKKIGDLLKILDSQKKERNDKQQTASEEQLTNSKLTPNT